MRGGARGFLSLLAALAGGCSGGARLHFVSLNPSAIDPPPPTVHRYDPQECYHWVDADGRLNIAMRFENVSLIGDIGKLAVEMSLVLEAPPAGSGRDFRVGQREVRVRIASRIEEHRFLAYTGIVSVVREKNGDLRGSFRLWLYHYAGMPIFALFPPRSGNFLLFGTFRSVPDATRGTAIRERTESAGWHRAPPRRPTTQPAPRPAGTTTP